MFGSPIWKEVVKEKSDSFTIKKLEVVGRIEPDGLDIEVS